jgi:hypothetical protein
VRAASKMYLYVCGGAVRTHRALGPVVIVLKTNGGMHESEKVVNMLVL